MSVIYNKNFYKDQKDGSFASAQKVVPFIYNAFKPESVLDIGCGVATWLSVFANKYSVTDIVGVDGDYVNKQMLNINPDKFVSYDLKKVYNANRKFDLAMSLEVGEHLPEESADNLVESLTTASDIVLFSAAIPNQIGTYHINEQYAEYWAKKFIKKGYIPIDFLRSRIWNEPDVEWWYKQNMILYITENAYQKHKDLLQPYREMTNTEHLTRIHPDMMKFFVDKYYQLQNLTGFIRYKLYFFKKWILNK